jgi:hypothetical protein
MASITKENNYRWSGDKAMAFFTKESKYHWPGDLATASIFKSPHPLICIFAHSPHPHIRICTHPLTRTFTHYKLSNYQISQLSNFKRTFAPEKTHHPWLYKQAS